MPTPATKNNITATKNAPFINSLGMKFVPVPGTEVFICIHETRKSAYARYAAANSNVNNSWMKVEQEGVAVSDGDTHPVVRVSWNDAQMFCAWLSKREGHTYRLPSDHEWSMAAGIGDREGKDALPQALDGKIKDTYPWGNQWPPPLGTGNFADSATQEKFPNLKIPGYNNFSFIGVYSDTYPTTAPVMSFAPNSLGIYDLSGNVWEWCEDWYSAKQDHRVLRGGSWRNGGKGSLLSACRTYNVVFGRFVDYGFRCVLESFSGTSAAASVAPLSTTPPAPKPAPVPASITSTANAPFTNTLGMKFFLVPGTDVLFCIHETRRQDYAAYAAEVPGVDGTWKLGHYVDIPFGHEATHPVAGVSWDDAQAFCSWLSKKEGKTYRLPTDKEWSYAVGIGSEEKWTKETVPASVVKNQTSFPWGDYFPPKSEDKAGNFRDISMISKFPNNPGPIIQGYDDGFVTTSPVMSFRPNNFGIYDLGGNVDEWVEDWWNAAKNDRVLRSSSFDTTERSSLLSSSRKHYPPGSRRYYVLGFRCVLEK